MLAQEGSDHGLRVIVNATTVLPKQCSYFLGLLVAWRCSIAVIDSPSAVEARVRAIRNTKFRIGVGIRGVGVATRVKTG